MTFADTTILDAAIANGQNDSNALDLSGRKYLCLIMPATFDGTQISFLVSDSIGGTYVELDYDDGTQVIATVAQGKACALSSKAAIALAAAQYVKLHAVTPQTGNRTIKVIAEAG